MLTIGCVIDQSSDLVRNARAGTPAQTSDPASSMQGRAAAIFLRDRQNPSSG